MKNTNINTIIAITTGIFILLTVGVFSVNAAPAEDYFTSTTDTQVVIGNDFINWLNENRTQLTQQMKEVWDDLLSAVGKENNLAGVAVTTDDSDSIDDGQNNIVETPVVELMDNRCIKEDGVAEIELEEVTAYKLTFNNSVYDLSDGEVGADFLTFADLKDGSYTLTGFNTNGNDETSFTVACDSEAEDINNNKSEDISAQCKATPKQPNIGDEVKWEVEVSGDTTDFTYDWSGDVSGSDDRVIMSYDSTGEKEGFATIASDDNQKTVRCSVGVGDNDSNIQSINNSAAVSRTIENF